jgi:futalosine hydrolase
MQPTLIIAAVPRELVLLTATMEDVVVTTGAFPATEGFIGSSRLVCCAAGIGKANAAAASAVLIEQYQPRRIIITGCGGAYPGSGLAVGDLAVASEELFGDEGTVTPRGWLDLKQMGLPLLQQGERNWYGTIPLSLHDTEKVLQLADSHGLRLTRGRFVTVSACSGTKERGLELARRHQAICENMEGAAVALNALRYGVPCLEIRGISNLVEDRDLSRWEIDRAVEAAQRLVIKIVEELER